MVRSSSLRMSSSRRMAWKFWGRISSGTCTTVSIRVTCFSNCSSFATMLPRMQASTNLFHTFGHAVGVKAAQQLIIQSQEEARVTWIALSSGTTTQLQVNAARLVSLGTNDVQAPQRYNSIVIRLAFAHLLMEQIILLL